MCACSSCAIPRSWKFSNPEDIIHYSTMRLILQPIIENAVSHSAAPDVKTRRIKIKLSRFHGEIRVRIINTGAGMSRDQLARLREILAGDQIPPKGIGLYNINKRFQLQYDTRLELYSSPRRGTTVAFHFPAEAVQPFDYLESSL